MPDRAGASQRSPHARRMPIRGRPLRRALDRPLVDEAQGMAERRPVNDPRLVRLGAFSRAAQLADDVVCVVVDPLARQQGAATAAAAFALVGEAGDAPAQQRQLEVGRVAHRRLGKNKLHGAGFDGANTVPATLPARHLKGMRHFILSYPFLNGTANISRVQDWCVSS